MTWTTIGIIWFVTGIISAIWHWIAERRINKIMEFSTFEKIAESCILVVVALVAGPIGLVIKIYEEIIDRL